jgi:hypothetical protein
MKTAQEKIDALFDGLTRRFGTMPLKDGQDVKSVKATWALSVGRYKQESLFTAATEWAATSKYNTWPSEGEFLAILRGMGSEVERGHDSRETSWKNAEDTFYNWHKGIMERPAVNGEIIGQLQLNDVLADVIRSYWPESHGKKFGRLGAEAVLRGDLPQSWNKLASAVMEAHARGREGYRDYVMKHGVKTANESYIYG